MSRSGHSQHLRVLRDAGPLVERGAGTRRLYRALPEGLRALRDWSRDYSGVALDDLKDAAESEANLRHGAAGDRLEINAVVSERHIDALPRRYSPSWSTGSGWSAGWGRGPSSIPARRTSPST